MKKIMFNDQYNLTKSVLNGNKTMTRRIIKEIPADDIVDISEWGLNDGGKACITLYEGGRPTTDIFPAYQPEDVVAVAQPYKDLDYSNHNFATSPNMDNGIHRRYAEKQAGWNNKMFVSSKFMPHQIRITNIKVERLQDISDEDCLREGITTNGVLFYILGEGIDPYPSAKSAFKSLIDSISGKGTWEKNPWVFAYSFQLVK